MRHWWVDNHETILAALAHREQSVLELHGVQRKSASKEERPLTEIVRRSTKGIKGREKPHHIMPVKNRGTLFTSEEHARSSKHTKAQVLNHILSERSTNCDEPNLTFVGRGTHCQVCYSSNQVTWKFGHLIQHSRFLWARKWDYAARF